MTETESDLPRDDDAARIRTFLIADVRGYTRFTLEQGDEAAARLAGRFAVLCRDIVASHEGAVTELRGDEALAVFTSARQAMRAAVALQAGFEEEMSTDPSLPLRVGIGLDAGEAIQVEGGFRGAALNLAARLCSLAGPGEVLASEALLHLARRTDGITHEERGYVTVKGFAAPVQIVRVLPASDAIRTTSEPPDDSPPEQTLPIGGFLGALPPEPMVDRRQDLASCLQALQAVESGHGRTLLLVGEPGIGKTRLAQELTIDARNRGFVIAVGACFEARESTAFFPFLDIVGTLYEFAPASLRARVPTHYPVLHQLLPATGVSLSPASMEGRDDLERVARPLASFLEEFSQHRALAIFVEDLHWSDSSSLDLLLHLSRTTRNHRILLVGTYREAEIGRHHGLEGVLRELTRADLVERVAVHRLDEQATVELITSSLQDDVSSEFTSLLYGRTEGNPFFLRQVLRMLAEGRDSSGPAGRWDEEAIATIDVPESIRSMIGQRVSGISSAAQEVLYEASILGQSVRFDDLLQMTGRAEPELEQALDQAVQAALLYTQDGEQYRFDHALTQQSLHAEIPLRRQRRLHMAAATALENLPESKRSRRVSELAWHFLHGNDTGKALSYALLAGDALAEQYAQGDAEKQYRTAIDLAEELGERPRWAEAMEKLGWAFRSMGRYDDALAALDQAAATYSELGDTESELRAMVRIGRTHWLAGSVIDGINRLEPVLTTYRSTAHVQQLAELHMVLGYLYFPAGRYDDELAVTTTAAEIARDCAVYDVLAHAELMRGVALLMLARPREGLRTVLDALPWAQQTSDLEAEAHLSYNAAIMQRILGQIAPARDMCERTLAIGRRMEDPFMTGVALHGMGMVDSDLGRWDEAIAFFLNSDSILRPLDSWHSAYPLCGLGVLFMSRGEFDEGKRYLDEAEGIGARSGDRQVLRVVEESRAEYDLMEGRHMAAGARLESFLDRPELVEVDIVAMTPLLALLAWARLEAGETREALESAQQAVELARQSETEYALSGALRILGRVQDRLNEYAEATRTFHEAISLASTAPYRFELGRIHLEWGCTSTADDERARHLTAAVQIFRELRAQPYFVRAERVLRLSASDWIDASPPR